MAITKKQYQGIKFPFTNNNNMGFFVDLNNTVADKYESQILHVILTPKRTRIRMPQFGTDLIKYIFDPNDESEWSTVKEEITNSVSTYVPNVTLENIEIDQPKDNEIFLDIKYTYQKGNTTETRRLVTQI